MSARDIFDELVAGGWPAVQSWIDGEHAESEHLEFKRRAANAPSGDLDDADQARLGVAISALANVAGGVVVFGLHEATQQKNRPDRLAKVQTAFLADAEAFEAAIKRHMRQVTEPPVGGLATRAIIDPSNAPRGVVVVYVPDSEGKPHRTAEGLARDSGGRYYMRTSTSSVVMPHPLLAALFGRAPTPRLRLIARWIQQVNGPQTIRMTLRNDGRGTAVDPAVLFAIEPMQDGQRVLLSQSSEARRVPTSRGVVPVARPHTGMPLHSTVEDYLCTFEVHSWPPAGPRTVHLIAKLVAMNTQPIDIDEIVTFDSPGDVRVIPGDTDQGDAGDG